MNKNNEKNSQEKIRIANSPERSSTPLIIKEIKNKCTSRYTETLIRLTKPRVGIFRLCYQTAHGTVN